MVKPSWFDLLKRQNKKITYSASERRQKTIKSKSRLIRAGSDVESDLIANFKHFASSNSTGATYLTGTFDSINELHNSCSNGAGRKLSRSASTDQLNQIKCDYSVLLVLVIAVCDICFYL